MSASVPAQKARGAVGAWLGIGAVYVYLYLPILILVVFSFNASRQMAVWTGFSFDWYAKAWQDDAVIQSLRTSLFVAFLSTVISVVLGTPAAMALGRHRFRGRGLVDGLFYLPVVIPEIVLGFASVVFFGLAGWKLGFWSVVVAHVAFSISYVVFTVRARLSMLDPKLEEAAADLGAPPLDAFLRVTLPLLVPGLVSAGLLVFTISLDDYVVTSFVAGSGGTTLPLQIYSMVRTGVTPEINAISTILLVATFVLVLLSQRYESGAAGRGTSAIAAAVVIALGIFSIGGPVRDAGKRELSVYIWSQYLPDELVAEFEARYGVRVNVELYDSNEAMLAKLQTGVASYDIVVPSDYMIEILRQNDLLSEIDTRRLTNLDNLNPRFLGLPFDPENRYSIPYGWGTSGIGYRKDLCPKPIDSWADLWDPALRDRLGMLNDARENFAAALKREGKSLNSKDEAEIERAAKLVEELKPLVRTFESDTFAENLLAGEVWVTQGYSGQIARVALEDPNIAYVIPKEGCTVFVDSMCIPKGAPNEDLAHLFIDFVLEGRSAARITEVMGFATPNRASLEFLPDAYRNNTAIFPPDEALDNCEFMTDLGEAMEVYDRFWTRIKS